MENDLQKRYSYKNTLKICPNCGAGLSENDKECPACSINLIGFNEEENRIDNFNIVADNLDEITEKNKELSERSKAEAKKKEKASKIIKITLISIATIIFAIIFFAINNEFVINVANTSRYKTSKQVAQSFENAEIEYNKTIGPFNLDFQELIKEEGNKDQMYISDDINGYEQYRSKTEDGKFLTTYTHYHSNGQYSYKFNFQFKENILYLPETSLFGNEISFEQKRASTDFEYEYVYNEANSCDKMVIDKFVSEKNNIIEKYGKITIKQNNASDIVFDVYIQEKPNDGFEPYKVIFTTKLNDNLFYVIEMPTYNKEKQQQILENIEDYLAITFQESFIANLD